MTTASCKVKNRPMKINSGRRKERNWALQNSLISILFLSNQLLRRSSSLFFVLLMLIRNQNSLHVIKFWPDNYMKVLISFSTSKNVKGLLITVIMILLLRLNGLLNKEKKKEQSKYYIPVKIL